eukprot:9979383-Alexandrium_andersonii.AAC.1
MGEASTSPGPLGAIDARQVPPRGLQGLETSCKSCTALSMRLSAASGALMPSRDTGACCCACSSPGPTWPAQLLSPSHASSKH